MGNLDLFMLTSVIVTLFLVFIIGIVRSVKGVNENSYKNERPGGPRVMLFNAMAKLLDGEPSPKRKKKIINKMVGITISDMESNGVYFSEEDKKKLKIGISHFKADRSGPQHEYTLPPSVINKNEIKNKQKA